MTMEKDSFKGLMSSLNLDTDKFIDYKIHQDLNYQQLALIKKSVEDQLTMLFDILSDEFKVDMNTPLVTGDGFPRDDIDVVSVRLVRVKIIRLRNDHKSVLELIEGKLQQQLKRQEGEKGQDKEDGGEDAEDGMDIDGNGINDINDIDVVFARIDDVIHGSPAHTAGLLEGDQVVVFDGDINAENHNHLNKVVNRVQASLDRPIPVEVRRNREVLRIELTPTLHWGGRGLLGCKIVPI